jgi:hypothetical protein
MVKASAEEWEWGHKRGPEKKGDGLWSICETGSVSGWLKPKARM